LGFSVVRLNLRLDDLILLVLLVLLDDLLDLALLRSRGTLLRLRLGLALLGSLLSARRDADVLLGWRGSAGLVHGDLVLGREAREALGCSTLGWEAQLVGDPLPVRLCES
jgi:hypothetical protein